MAHPLLWPKKNFFYPIGNTSPICLTQDIAPEQSANILLLGCGDPRNILFTIYSSGLDNAKLPHTLDFTCCDIEPAIIARNILLFTLIADGEASITGLVWDIFYDFYLSRAALALLTKHCQKLVELSNSLNSWHNSKYGVYLRICTCRTLDELRRYWTLYAKFEDMPSARKTEIVDAYNAGLQRTAVDLGANLSSARSAGPLSTKATRTQPPTIDFVLQSIQNQFADWCKAFVASTRIDVPMITIRFFTGDALSLCRAFHQCSTTSSTTSGCYVRPWSAAQLELDGGDYAPHAGCRAPVSFDVIDTSNLTDHVGLLNILVVATPILFQSPSSTIYTETLLPSGTDALYGFTDHICGDLTVMSILLDLIPTTFVSRFMSQSNVHEIMFYRFSSGDSQFHQRIAWKILSLADSRSLPHAVALNPTVSFDPNELGIFLFSVYLKMFSEEDMGDYLQQMFSDKSAFHKRVRNGNIIHYVRASFAALLKVVKGRIPSESWTSVMEAFFGHLNADRTLTTGSNNYQDLCCQLHILDIYSVQSIGALNKGRFKGWHDVPSLVCVVLVVPRHALSPLETMDVNEVGTPPLQCEVRGAQFHCVFSSIHTVFGAITATSSDPDAELVLDEDPRAWSGISDLIVSFWMPSWILTVEPSSTHIGFGLRSTPVTARFFFSKKVLDLDLLLFKASLIDTKHIFVARRRPNFPQEMERIKAVSNLSARSTPTSRAELQTVVTMEPARNRQILDFRAKVEIVDDHARQLLASGLPVVSEQMSPCTVKVTFGSIVITIAYPFPVDGTRIKLRIARKSHFIEAITPPSGFSTAGGFFSDNFPVIFRGKTPTIWNIHRLYLDRLPALNLSQEKDMSWLKVHLALMLSDRERNLKGSGQNAKQNEHETLADLKESLHSLFFQYAGLEDRRRSSVLGLIDPSWGGPHTLFFVNDMRLDLSSHTVVLDAYVLPNTAMLIQPGMKLALRRLQEQGVLQTVTVGEEIRAWKHLLPALVERCRWSWTHGDDCEYLKTGNIPPSLEYTESPICSCGRGKDVDALRSVKEWAPFAPFVTRVAVSPLFAVSYLDSVGSVFDDVQSENHDDVTGGHIRKQEPPSSASNSREPSLSPLQIEACEACGGGGQPRLMLCSKCRKVRYCSSACQKADWKKHKVICR
ncbi:hypothetical protein EW146_g1035 [Bondarzewia mesenterica]|uniref:MYND-type domain-containing protein n=1 Tax=Bondarzewia mesenterica TaxID=1095465 RepID=A0A4S4M6H1_9AGAM|nr:hypothetical protein EW146_g1035 [Bondarzewia mesenterica]